VSFLVLKQKDIVSTASPEHYMMTPL